MWTVEQLLAPAAGGGAGEDLAFSSDFDAIARARQFDEPGLEQGVWVAPCKEADWNGVAQRCAQLLEQRSKDLRLAVWLAEACARRGDLRGLGDAMLVLAGLCERYWDSLYPLSESGEHEARIGNLAWLARGLPQWLLSLPLSAAPACSLGDLRSAARGSDEAAVAADAFRLACQGSGAGFREELSGALAHCGQALAHLDAGVDAVLGQDAPSFGEAHRLLADMTDAVRAAGPAQESLAVAAPEGGGMPGRPIGTQAGSLTRSQALQALRQVAEFFHRTEPHSPVGYLAERAANWGDMPLHIWLRTVVKDGAVVGQLEELLGAADEPAAGR